MDRGGHYDVPVLSVHGRQRPSTPPPPLSRRLGERVRFEVSVLDLFKEVVTHPRYQE